tara:strand:- start:3606 stop:3773 length:168 start_codon:yes stop_codon:yes gene_type:complete
VPYILRYLIKKNLEKFQQHQHKNQQQNKKKEAKKDFDFKSKKDVGEYIDYEEIDE